MVTTADGSALTGMDRKVLTALDDPTLRAGFPKRLGAGGEAPIRYADLDGDNRQELVVPTEDGRVHAYEPDGSELPGWPVHTRDAVRRERPPRLARRSQAARPRPLEPPRGADDRRPRRRRAARGHHHRGQADLRVGRRRARAARLARCARTRRAANCAPSQQTKPLKHPKCGFLAAPGDRAPRRRLAAARHRRARPRRARLRAYRPDGKPAARLPGAADRPGGAAGRADDRRVDQPRRRSATSTATGATTSSCPPTRSTAARGGGGDVSFGSAAQRGGRRRRACTPSTRAAIDGTTGKVPARLADRARRRASRTCCR